MINSNLIFFICDSQRSLLLIYKLKFLIFVFDFVIVIFKFIVINILNRLELRVKYINLYFFEAKITSCVVIYRKYISCIFFKIE